MLNLTDIVALAKQGYKPNDIKELIELTKEAPEGKPEDQEKQPIPEDAEKPSEDKPKEEEKKDGGASPDQLDYKEEVEKLKAQLQEKEDKLAKLQKENVRRNADTGDKKPDAEAFADVMRSFM